MLFFGWLLVISLSLALGDDLGFLKCGQVTLQPVKWNDWYVVVGFDGRGTLHGNDYIFDFLVDNDAKFSFVRINKDNPLFYIINHRNGQDLYVYMTDSPTKRVESSNAVPGENGQWHVNRVENGKYTLSPVGFPNLFLCMNGDYFGTMTGCDGVPNDEGTFKIRQV